MSILTDAQIIQLIQKAARFINRELSLFNTTDEIVIDSAGNMTSPDDESLYDLVRMQTECMILQRNMQAFPLDGSVGTLIKDGEQTIDTTSGGDLLKTFFQGDSNPCKDIKLALRDEKLLRNGGHNIW